MLTQEEVGKILGITRQAVNATEKTAIRKLWVGSLQVGIRSRIIQNSVLLPEARLDASGP